MAVNAEAVAIELLRSGGFEAYADVPAERPLRFVTVERVGGGRSGRVLDSARMAVQCWAESRFEASQLANDVCDCIEGMVADGRVANTSVDSVYNFPDTENRQPRYQVTAYVTVMG